MDFLCGLLRRYLSDHYRMITKPTQRSERTNANACNYEEGRSVIVIVISNYVFTAQQSTIIFNDQI